MEEIGRKNRGSREKARGARLRALSRGDRKSAAKMESPSKCSPGHAERLSSFQRERAQLLQSDPYPVREIAPPLSGAWLPVSHTELFSIPCESSSNLVRQSGSRYNYLFFVGWAGRQNFPNSLEDPPRNGGDEGRIEEQTSCWALQHWGMSSVDPSSIIMAMPLLAGLLLSWAASLWVLDLAHLEARDRVRLLLT